MKKKLKVNRFIIIGVIIYFIFVLISQQQTINALQDEIKMCENTKIEEEKRTEELREEIENINSIENIEKVARKKRGMYMPNERVYIDVTK